MRGIFLPLTPTVIARPKTAATPPTTLFSPQARLRVLNANTPSPTTPVSPAITMAGLFRHSKFPCSMFDIHPPSVTSSAVERSIKTDFSTPVEMTTPHRYINYTTYPAYQNLFVKFLSYAICFEFTFYFFQL